MCMSLNGQQLQQAADQMEDKEGNVWRLPVAAGLLLYSRPDSGSLLF